MKLSEKLISLIKLTMANSIAKVTKEEENTDPIKLERRVRPEAMENTTPYSSGSSSCSIRI